MSLAETSQPVKRSRAHGSVTFLTTRLRQTSTASFCPYALDLTLTAQYDFIHEEHGTHALRLEREDWDRLRFQIAKQPQRPLAQTLVFHS